MADEKTARAGNDPVVTDKAAQDVETGETGLNRALSGRHLQFIAIGGTIGTGLFIGTGSALFKAGPASLLACLYFCRLRRLLGHDGPRRDGRVHACCWCLYRLRLAISSTRLLASPWAGSTGSAGTITYALELTAAGLIIQYWNSSLNIGIWIGVFWLIFTAANFLPIRWFGELEMWFSSIKVITIIGFIIFSICINAARGRPGLHWLQVLDVPPARSTPTWSAARRASLSASGRRSSRLDSASRGPSWSASAPERRRTPARPFRLPFDGPFGASSASSSQPSSSSASMCHSTTRT